MKNTFVLLTALLTAWIAGLHCAALAAAGFSSNDGAEVSDANFQLLDAPAERLMPLPTVPTAQQISETNPSHREWQMAGNADVAPTPPAHCAAEQPWVESTWYTRIDYFHWNERFMGADFENEDGPFWTLGYVRRVGAERFRAELFDSTVNASSMIDDGSGGMEPLKSITKYLGVRAEYDLLFDPETLPHLSFFAGIGTRFWIRDLPDDFTASGTFIQGYQETWWTFYPYIGMETRRDLNSGAELYGMGRIGLTAITWERASINELPMYPRPGITGQLEGGMRGRHLFLSAFCEAMNWQQSAEVRGWLQPTSTMLTVGLRTGLSF